MRAQGKQRGQTGPAFRAFSSGLAEADRLDAKAEAALFALLYGLAKPPLTEQGRLRISPSPQGGALIEIIHPDRPFLLASVGMALTEMGLSPARVAHPVLKARRDAKGRLIAAGGKEGQPESWMQFLLKDPLDDKQAELAALRVAQVLADLRLVVDDWFKMRKAVFAVAASQSDPEAKSFLEWIEDGHFTLMGHGRFAVKKGRLVQSVKGLGLFSLPGRDYVDAQALAVGAGVSSLFIAKADKRSTVHRKALLDLVGVPDGQGGLDLFLGLFAADAYASETGHLPWVRRKCESLRAHFAFDPLSHNGRLLANIIETLPRDILFHCETPALIRLVQGVLELQDRSRVALFLLHDRFNRFMEALVYAPREGYDTSLRLKFRQEIENAFQGQTISEAVLLNDSPLARFHLIVKRQAGGKMMSEAALERRLVKAARGWEDDLAQSLAAKFGERDGRLRFLRCAKAFPASYREAESPKAAVADSMRMQALLDGADVAAAFEEQGGRLRFKLMRLGGMVPLSEVLPRLENLGFAVLSETPHRLSPAGAGDVWLHVFDLAGDGKIPPRKLEEAFLAVWRKECEDDAFNRLVGLAGLSWREAALLRALARYLLQAAIPFSLAYMAEVLVRHPQAAGDLVALFDARHKPASKSDGRQIEERILAYLDGVANADEDRILKRFVNLILAVLRSDYHKGGSVMAFKIRSAEIDGLPEPKPWAEIWVHGPSVEGVHLRGGPVARGGIRWSDRPEDFRTEILGLMKAQTVKNTVIVPVGAKGGFVVRQPPKEGGREAFLQEGVACYKRFISALLGLTDNLKDGRVVAPKGIVRRDGDDPYLVVAADKGTASFSDIANALSQERGFWLGDAFASGGSKGYDHKGMGVTAKGAWVSVRRHFSELGLDPEKDNIRALGVGDMSGDVFGNGLLRSKSVKLVAAFDHRHVFIDPDPDPALSFNERQRLFNLARSSWADYDAKRISKGGGVFDRALKSAPLSREAQAMLGVKAASLPPAELIKALLSMPVDLIWFGGIGTYVKASGESHAQAGDRANDAVRLDACDLKAKVIGEGANLALTQAARTEFAKAGGRVNTDAIDNSAGVDTSDHEVNIKILLNGLVAKRQLTMARRDRLLKDLTGEVERLVLRDNELQNLSLSLAQHQGVDLLDGQIHLMRHLEKLGRLDRKLAGLPSETELAERLATARPLLRPELAQLMAYAKIWLKDEILKSPLADDKALAGEALGCFPKRLAAGYAKPILAHPLKRELLATHIVNSLINRLGPTFPIQMIERTGAPAWRTAAAYLAVRDGLDLRPLWDEAISRPNIAAKAQYALLLEINRLVERMACGLLGKEAALSVGESAGRLKAAAAALKPHLASLLDAETKAPIDERCRQFQALGAPADLARKTADLILLASVEDIQTVSRQAKKPLLAVAKTYFAVGQRFGLNGLKRMAENLNGGSHWQRLARFAVIEELHQCQRELAAGVVAHGGMEGWLAAKAAGVARIDQLLGEIRAVDKAELAALALAARRLRTAV